MSLIDNIIDITIKKSTLGITSAGFDSLLIIGNSKKVYRVKAYSSINEVVEDYENTTPEYKAALLAFGQSTKLNKVLIGQAFVDETYAIAYPKIEQENNDFYGVAIIGNGTDPIQDIIDMSAIIETKDKIFGVSSNDLLIRDPNDTTSILSTLKAANIERTVCMYSSKANATEIFPEISWLGLMLTKDPGSATWAYKTLSGFEADKLSTTTIDIIDNKNGNCFVPLSGRDITLYGKTTSGEYIDVIQGLDWLKSQMKISIANSLILNDKIPYTNPGIAIIESMIRNSLNMAADRNIIVRETIKVTVPDVRDISFADKQARKLTDVKFEARLAGAIHKIKIQGTVEL